jgi:solute carrier family 35, member E1
MSTELKIENIDAEVPWKRTPVWCLMLLWYGSAGVAVISSRSILKKTFSLPFSLSAVQFLLSTIFSYGTLTWLLPWSTNGSYKSMITSFTYEDPVGKLVRIISLSFTLGFILTNVSLSLCNASFTETVKASEPISSLLLATLLGGDGSVSKMEWLTALPIVFGVGLCSFSESNFNLFGFVAAVASNFMFSLRGINTKKLRCGFNIYT